jgi:sec-independent protein translocase protein TatA
MNTHLLLFLGLGMTEGVLIFFAVLLLFGGKKIPELMRGLGKGVREFNDARNTVSKELREGMSEGERERRAADEQTKIAVPRREEIEK